jgi:SSS family solute:Na+ symporter
MNPFFGWKLDLNWDGILNTANAAHAQDGNEFFSIIFGLMFFKGVLASLAGPAPNYDMQRILATRNPREACLMNGMVTVVLMFPRYMMIAGITVLALAFCMPRVAGHGKPDFEKVLPDRAERLFRRACSASCWPACGGLHVEFRRHPQRRPGLRGERHLQALHQPQRRRQKRSALSRLVALRVPGHRHPLRRAVHRITEAMMWLVGSLYGGFVVANVLKWYWWRFNGYGYFWGMVAGIGGAMVAKPIGVAIIGHGFNLLYTFPAIPLCHLGHRLRRRHAADRTRGRGSAEEILQDVNPGAAGGRSARRSCRRIRLPAQSQRGPRPRQRRRRHRVAALPRDAGHLHRRCASGTGPAASPWCSSPRRFT